MESKVKTGSVGHGFSDQIVPEGYDESSIGYAKLKEYDKNKEERIEYVDFITKKGLEYSPCKEIFIIKNAKKVGMTKEAILYGSREYWRCISNGKECVQFARVRVWPHMTFDSLDQTTRLTVTIGYPYDKSSDSLEYLYVVRMLLDCIFLEASSAIQGTRLTLVFDGSGTDISINNFRTDGIFGLDVHYGKYIKRFYESPTDKKTFERKWVRWEFSTEDNYTEKRTPHFRLIREYKRQQPKMDMSINPDNITIYDYQGVYWLTESTQSVQLHIKEIDDLLKLGSDAYLVQMYGRRPFEGNPEEGSREYRRVIKDAKDRRHKKERNRLDLIPLLWESQKSSLYIRMLSNLIKYHTSRMLTLGAFSRKINTRSFFKREFLEYDLIVDSNSITFVVKLFRYQGQLDPLELADVNPHPLRKYWDMFYNVASMYAYDNCHVVFTDTNAKNYAPQTTLAAFNSKYSDTLTPIPPGSFAPVPKFMGIYPAVRLQLNHSSHPVQKLDISHEEFGSIYKFIQTEDPFLFTKSYESYGTPIYRGPQKITNQQNPKSPSERSKITSAIKMSHLGNRRVKSYPKYIALVKDDSVLAAIEYEKIPSMTKNSFPDIRRGEKEVKETINIMTMDVYNDMLYSDDFVYEYRVSGITAQSVFYLTSLIREWINMLSENNIKNSLLKKPMCSRVVFIAHNTEDYLLYNYIGLERESLVVLMGHQFGAYQINLNYLTLDEVEKLQPKDKILLEQRALAEKTNSNSNTGKEEE